MGPLLLLSLSLTCGAEPQGILKADQEIVNLGEIGNPTGTGHKFVLTNKGTGDLRFVDVVAPCGCAKPRLSARTLAPNGTCDLSISVNPLTQPEGLNSWNVKVTYHDGKELQSLTLALKAKVKKEILVEPSTLFMSGSKEISGTIRVIDRRKDKLKITGASSGLPETEHAINEGESTIEIRVGEKCPASQYATDLVIKTNDPTYPELRVPIRVTKRKEALVQAYPDELDLKFTGTETEAVGNIRIRGSAPVKIEKIVSSQEFVQCKHAEGPGNLSTVRVTLDRKQITESGSAEVKILFEDKTQPPLVIPVSWTKPE